MAARKKTVAKAKAVPAKKAAAPKPAPAKKAVAAKPAAAAAAKAPAKKAAPAAAKKEPSATAAVEALAKRIVKLTTGEPSHIDLADLYAPECVSHEPIGEPARGYDGLNEKNKTWGQMQKRSLWTPLHVATKGNTILIEWSAEVELRDGRTITLREVAVHNTRNGKIVEERYYYDPTIFAPPAEATAAAEAPAARPARRPTPPPPIETHGTPTVDPIDL